MPGASNGWNSVQLGRSHDSIPRQHASVSSLWQGYAQRVQRSLHIAVSAEGPAAIHCSVTPPKCDVHEEEGLLGGGRHELALLYLVLDRDKPFAVDDEV